MFRFILCLAVLCFACDIASACDRYGSSAASQFGQSSNSHHHVTNIVNGFPGGGGQGDQFGNGRFGAGDFAGSMDLYGRRGKMRASLGGRAAFQMSNRGKKPFKRIKGRR